MRTKLNISAELALPADVVTSTLVVYGGKGMGKTNLGSVLVEELSKAGLRWATLDPLGVWWGLRHAKDGKGPGIECLILGGAHGDIPIEPTGGAVVADLVVDEPASVIIDFSRKPSGEMWSIGEKTRFLTDYALRLFRRQGELVEGMRREPIFQILDEAARYIPQIIPAGNPDLSKCLSAWNTLVEEGRNVGIGVGLLTQRSARMNKSVSELADAMLSFRIVGPNSIAAVTDWLGEHVSKDRLKQHIEILRSLERGRCLVVSPGWLQFEGVVMIRARETFDSSATPKPGEKAQRVTGSAAKPDLAKYAARMRATIEKAKENDPRELKEQIRKLKAELAAAAKQTAVPPSPGVVTVNEEKARRAIEKGIRAAIKKRDEEWISRLREYDKQLERLILQRADVVRGAAEDVRSLRVSIGGWNVPEPPTDTNSEVPADHPRFELAAKSEGGRGVIARAGTDRPPSVPSGASNNGDITGPQRRILMAIASFEAIGRPKVAKKWVAALSGVSHSSGSYASNLGALRSAGYLDYPAPGEVTLTDAGRAHAPQVDAPATPEEMVERCKQIVTGPQARILDVLCAKMHPHTMDKSEVAERTGVSDTSGSFANNLGALRSAGMIDYPAPGKVRAADWLFLE